MRVQPPNAPSGSAAGRDYHDPDYRLGTLTSITIYHDYICPWCWVGWKQAYRLTQEFGVTFDWRGAELIPPSMDYTPSPRKPRNPDLPPSPPSRFDLFLESEGIVLPSPRPEFVRSHRALLGAEYVWMTAPDRFDAFNEAVYRGYWERHDDISDLDVLTGYAIPAGLDPKAFQDAVTSEQYVEHILPFDDDAYALGVRHVPTFIFNAEEQLAEAPYSCLAGATERFLIRSSKIKERLAKG